MRFAALMIHAGSKHKVWGLGWTYRTVNRAEETCFNYWSGYSVELWLWAHPLPAVPLTWQREAAVQEALSWRCPIGMNWTLNKHFNLGSSEVDLYTFVPKCTVKYVFSTVKHISVSLRLKSHHPSISVLYSSVCWCHVWPLWLFKETQVVYCLEKVAELITRQTAL